MKVAVFVVATGVIQRVVLCPDEMVEAQAGAGEAVVEVSAAVSDATHRIAGGVAVLKTP